MSTQSSFGHGQRFPFDAGEIWWAGSGKNPPISVDRSHAAARGVFSDLTDRSGIKQALDQLGHTEREDLVKQVSHVIRSTHQEGDWPAKAARDLLEVVKSPEAVQHEFNNIDADVYEEMVGDLSDIIRLALTI
jgi:hypothetical protein